MNFHIFIPYFHNLTKSQSFYIVACKHMEEKKNERMRKREREIPSCVHSFPIKLHWPWALLSSKKTKEWNNNFFLIGMPTFSCGENIFFWSVGGGRGGGGLIFFLGVLCGSWLTFFLTFFGCHIRSFYFYFSQTPSQHRFYLDH